MVDHRGFAVKAVRYTEHGDEAVLRHGDAADPNVMEAERAA